MASRNRPFRLRFVHVQQYDKGRVGSGQQYNETRAWTSQDLTCTGAVCNSCRSSESATSEKIKSPLVGFDDSGRWDDGSDYTGAVALLIHDSCRLM
jgi:hypothetical protein